MKPDMLKNALAKHFEAGHKEGFKEGYGQGMIFTVQNYSAVMLLCLKDKFDFTVEQLQEMTFHTNNYFDSVIMGEVSLSDISTVLQEEENLNISFDGSIAGIDIAVKEDVDEQIRSTSIS